MNPQKFAELLTEGVHRVRIREAKSVQIVQDELGYALGREGGSAVEYWRKGHIPPKLGDVELLGREIANRGQLERTWLENFLKCADHPAPYILCDKLFGPLNNEVASSTLRTDEDGEATVPISSKPKSKTEIPHIDSFAPFIVGPPIVHPGKFFGRDAELRRIFDAWRNYPLQNVAIIGPKRSGKSSLLHYVKNIFAVESSQLRTTQQPPTSTGLLAMPEQFRWVYVDFQDARMWSQERLLRHILETLDASVPEPCDLNNFMDVMIDAVTRPTVILMDEIGAALSAPELDMPFWWSLRSLGTNLTDGNLGFMIASHEPPIELAAERGKPSPFFNIFGHVLTVGPIEDAAALELINSFDLKLAEEQTEWILETSQRWPLLLQILCHSRLLSLEEPAGQDNELWKTDGVSRIEPYAYLLNGSD